MRRADEMNSHSETEKIYVLIRVVVSERFNIHLLLIVLGCLHLLIGQPEFRPTFTYTFSNTKGHLEHFFMLVRNRKFFIIFFIHIYTLEQTGDQPLGKDLLGSYFKDKKHLKI